MANTTDITPPEFDPIYGQKVEDLTDHDRRQYEAWLARRQKAVAVALNITDQAQRTAASVDRSIQTRGESLSRYATAIRTSALIVIISAFIVAGVADFLSIWDLGWVVSWALPPISWLIVRRITGTQKAVTAIAEANNQAVRQLTITRQRLRPLLIASGNIQLLTESASVMAVSPRSYVTIFIRDTIITQLIELVPIIDIIPFYLGSVVKLVMNQRNEYRKAHESLAQLEAAFGLLDSLERFERNYLAGQATNAIAGADAIRPPLSRFEPSYQS